MIPFEIEGFSATQRYLTMICTLCRAPVSFIVLPLSCRERSNMFHHPLWSSNTIMKVLTFVKPKLKQQRTTRRILPEAQSSSPTDPLPLNESPESTRCVLTLCPPPQSSNRCRGLQSCYSREMLLGVWKLSEGLRTWRKSLTVVELKPSALQLALLARKMQHLLEERGSEAKGVSISQL